MTPAERELLLAMADKAVSPPDRVGFKWAAISNLAAQVRTEAKATQAAEALLSEPVGKGSVCEMCRAGSTTATAPDGRSPSNGRQYTHRLKGQHCPP